MYIILNRNINISFLSFSIIICFVAESQNYKLNQGHFLILQKGIEEYTYVIFVVILIASIVFIFFFVPETKNRSFDDIAASIAFGRAKKQPFREDGEEMQPMGEKA